MSSHRLEGHGSNPGQARPYVVGSAPLGQAQEATNRHSSSPLSKISKYIFRRIKKEKKETKLKLQQDTILNLSIHKDKQVG